MFRITIDWEEQARRQQVLKDELIADRFSRFARAAAEVQTSRCVGQTHGTGGAG